VNRKLTPPLKYAKKLIRKQSGVTDGFPTGVDLIGTGTTRRLADDACLITSSSTLAPAARLMTAGNLALFIGVKGFGIYFLLLSSHLARCSRFSPLVQEWEIYQVGHNMALRQIFPEVGACIILNYQHNRRLSQPIFTNQPTRHIDLQ